MEGMGDQSEHSRNYIREVQADIYQQRSFSHSIMEILTLGLDDGHPKGSEGNPDANAPSKYPLISGSNKALQSLSCFSPEKGTLNGICGAFRSEGKEHWTA